MLFLLADSSDSGIGSSSVAVYVSFAGIIITALLTLLTAVLRNKDRRERNADRRKIEEETTDVILKRVRRELDSAYELLDEKDAALLGWQQWADENGPAFSRAGITRPRIRMNHRPISETLTQVRRELDSDDDDDKAGCPA